jgi:hypothetical protein
MNKEYYYLLMSQQDLFQNEVIEEIMRERINSYNSLNKKNDFWILTAPKFVNDSEFQSRLKISNFYKQKEKNLVSYNNQVQFYACFLSFNKEFITWLSLRLGYFEDIDKLNKIKTSNLDYISNGITGKLVIKDEKGSKNTNFDFEKGKIHPTLLIQKYEKLLELFYFSK